MNFSTYLTSKNNFCMNLFTTNLLPILAFNLISIQSLWFSVWKLNLDVCQSFEDLISYWCAFYLKLTNSILKYMSHTWIVVFISQKSSNTTYRSFPSNRNLKPSAVHCKTQTLFDPVASFMKFLKQAKSTESEFQKFVLFHFVTESQLLMLLPKVVKVNHNTH